MNDFATILDEMGEPAALELLAEECTELAQAALKFARKKRAENPTPVSTQKCVEHVLEELADVMLCETVLLNADWFDAHKVDSIFDLKLKRWINRMVEHGKSRNHNNKFDT